MIIDDPDAQNDPKWHNYVYHNGGLDMNENQLASLYDEYKNPIGPTKIFHLFLTISLPNLPLEIESKREKVFEDLQKLRNIKYNYMKKKDIKARFEFHSLDKPLNYIKDNYHIHILVRGKIARFDKARIIRDFKNLFKVESNFIDIKYSDSPDLYTTRTEYVKGIKREEKTPAVIEDEKTRGALGIDELYSLSIL